VVSCLLGLNCGVPCPLQRSVCASPSDDASTVTPRLLRAYEDLETTTLHHNPRHWEARGRGAGEHIGSGPSGSLTGDGQDRPAVRGRMLRGFRAATVGGAPLLPGGNSGRVGRALSAV